MLLTSIVNPWLWLQMSHMLCNKPMLTSTTTTDAISRLPFGFSFICNQKSLKLRFKLATAEHIMNALPKHFHSNIGTLINAKGTHCMITCLAHHNSAIWPALETAINKGKAQVLRLQADALENSLPYMLALELEQERQHMEFMAELHSCPEDDLPF
jgi:hypothetical protein